MKIYNTKLFIGRLLICALIATWIFMTERMFLCLAPYGNDFVPCMILLHIFWGVGIGLSFLFWKDCESIFYWVRDFLKKTKVVAISLYCISMVICFEYCMLWAFRIMIPNWGWRDNFFFTIMFLGMSAIVTTIIICRKDIIEKISEVLGMFFVWLTAEKEANDFLEKV